MARAARCEAARAGSTDHSGRDDVTDPRTFTAVQVGVDTGGTFTDVVAADGRVGQGPVDAGRSRRGRCGRRSARPGLRAPPSLLAHGTTVATNALLERRGAAVALVTTEGLRDVIEIGRQDRPSLYDQLASRPEPLVPRELRYEVAGRLAADGSELAPGRSGRGGCAGDRGVGRGGGGVPAARRPRTRPTSGRWRRCCGTRGHDVTCSHEVSPEFREVERTVTTVVNAALRPRLPVVPAGPRRTRRRECWS